MRIFAANNAVNFKNCLREKQSVSRVFRNMPISKTDTLLIFGGKSARYRRQKKGEERRHAGEVKMTMMSTSANGYQKIKPPQKWGVRQTAYTLMARVGRTSG